MIFLLRILSKVHYIISTVLKVVITKWNERPKIKSTQTKLQA